MLFLGVLSVFQLLAIPGLLLIRLFPGKRGLIQNSVYVFMLSLLANYTVVFFLVSVGFYLRSVVLALFALEVAALVWLNRDFLLKVFDGSGARIRNSIPLNLKSFANWAKKDFWSANLYFVFGTLAVLGLIWVLWVWVSNFNTVYQTWDAWASWDRWATKWAENRFPGDTWEYPQLIPVTYSVAYKFIGTIVVKFFGKSIMPLFALVIGLMIFDLGKKFKSFGYMLGAGFTLYSLNYFLGKYLPEGYVDIPVACFSLMAIYSLLSVRGITNKKEIKSILLLGSLASAAAAVTKQTGLYITAFYPIFAYFWVLRGNKHFKTREAIGLLAKHLLLALALVLPWYVFIEYRIIFGGNPSNIQFVISDIYQGQTLPDRFIAAVAAIGNYVYVYIFLILSLVVLDNRFRQLVVLVILPFSVLWAFFLSYEARNLAIALVFLSLTIGVATEEWFQLARASLGKPLRPVWLWMRARILIIKELRFPMISVAVLGVVALGAATFFLEDKQIVDSQISQQRQIIEPVLNEKLYRFFAREGGPRPIITDYPIDWLPDLENMRRYDSFQSLDDFHRTLLRYPTADLVMVPLLSAHPQVLDEIWRNINAGIYQVILTEANYMLIRIPVR